MFSIAPILAGSRKSASPSDCQRTPRDADLALRRVLTLPFGRQCDAFAELD